MKIDLSISELKTIVTCCRGYRIPGAESLAGKVVDLLRDTGIES